MNKISCRAVIVFVYVFVVVFNTSAAASPEAQSSGAPVAGDCGPNPACRVWAGFRTERPFPHQGVAAGLSDDGALVIILSEPAPALAKAELRELVRAAFGADLLQYSEKRWMIGVDGWVEDVVLKVKWRPAQARLKDPLQDPLLRDRLSLLHKALYGSAFRGGLESASARFSEMARSAAPDIAATPGELRDWLTDAATSWMSVDAVDGARPVRIEDVMRRGPAGAYIDSERQLVVLALPHDVIEKARKDPAAMALLRAPFRKFAMASDAILGGAWDDKGSVVLVGRARRQPLASLPPLRFETFAMLAAETTRELQQSYERNNLLAGKLFSGWCRGRDWAPIFLSPMLIDSEFGALLNITDQILKSWSQAGNIEYLYFNYTLAPAKNAFVFGSEALSSILARETGASNVLFNWNTAGAAVTLAYPDMTVLAVGRTSALPVTYGSESAGEEMLTGDRLPKLRERENAAYAYFAGRRDPNLARVVSYTVMYQVLRAARPKTDEVAPKESVNTQRAKAETILTQEAERLLARVERGELTPIHPLLREGVDALLPAAQKTLRGFYERHGGEAGRLAQLLAGSNRFETDWDVFARRVTSYNRDIEALSGRIHAFNAEVYSYNNGRDGGYMARIRMRDWLAEEKYGIDKEQSRLELEGREIDGIIKAQNERSILLGHVNTVRRALQELNLFSYDPENVRDAYVKANDVEPAGRIKTPSVVVSWSADNLLFIGGHNLTARTLRIEIDPKVSALQFKTADDGSTILAAPPSEAGVVSSRAREIARAIEHENGKLDDVMNLLKGAPPRAARTRREVLGEADIPARFAACDMGCATVIDDTSLRPRLTSYLELDGAYAGVLMRDTEGYFVAARRDGGAVTCCERFLDTASMHEFVEGAVGKGDVLLLGENEGYAKTLAESVNTGDLRPIALDLGGAKAAAEGGGAGKRPPGPPGDPFAFDDDGFIFFGSQGGKGGQPEGVAGGGGRGQGPNGGGGQGSGGTGGSGGQGHGAGPDWARLRLVAQATEGGHARRIAYRPRDLSKAVSTEFEGAAAIRKARELGVSWKGDSEAYVITLRFEAEGGAALETNIAAGFRAGRAAEGKATLKEGIERIRGEDSALSLAKFHARLKSFVDERKERGGVEWIYSIIKSGALTFRLTSNDVSGRSL